ncbi:unnamed protein product [Urochloa humidicola]
MTRCPDLTPAGGSGKLLRPERERVGVVDVDPPSLLSSLIRSPRAPIAAARLADWLQSSRIELRVLRFRSRARQARRRLRVRLRVGVRLRLQLVIPVAGRAVMSSVDELFQARSVSSSSPSPESPTAASSHLYPLILGLHCRRPRGTPPRRHREATAATGHRRAGRGRTGVPTGRGIDRMRWLPSGGARTGRRPHAGERWREGGGGEGTWCRGGAAAAEEAGRRRQRRGRSHRTRFEKQEVAAPARSRTTEGWAHLSAPSLGGDEGGGTVGARPRGHGGWRANVTVLVVVEILQISKLFEFSGIWEVSWFPSLQD